ncbi:MAG: YcbK family protein, partial [Burkholderiaceae bacterium]
VRRRLLIAAGGALSAAALDAHAQTAVEENARLRELLSDRRELRLIRGDEQQHATNWSANTGYDRDQYLNVCWLMRDVQADRVFPINHQLLDVLCGVQTWLARIGVNAPLRIHSGFRTPKTNFKTEGAVLNSRHIVGRAADISVAGVPNLRLAGMASVLGKGGTGLYPGRSFVHVDTGDERTWVTPPNKTR